MNSIKLITVLTLMIVSSILLQGADYRMDVGVPPEVNQEKPSPRLGATPFLGDPANADGNKKGETKDDAANEQKNQGTQENQAEPKIKKNNSPAVEKSQGSKMPTQNENQEDIVRGY